MAVARPRTTLREFLRQEAAGGVLLVLAAALALALANSPAAPAYAVVLRLPVAVSAGGVGLDEPLLYWNNDGLMAVFFLLVGLEIKREALEGELSSRRKAALPIIAALGGMVAPAAVYTALNWGDTATLRGWAIPTATDIAFAVGVLALLGRHAPAPLRAFLLALAIIDDLGAIVIIGVFYTAQLSALALGLAGLCLLVLVALNRAGVGRIAPYALVGVVLWACVLESGVHATLAGVAVALAVPLRTAAGNGRRRSPLLRLEHILHPYVTWGILPLFAFANAGVDLRGLSPSALLDRVPLGIALGLLLGKQVGVFAATWAAMRLGLGALPARVDWRRFYGMAVLCGIGFTMSLFIGALAFRDPLYAAEVRLGVLCGSLVSALLGYALLRTVPALEEAVPRPARSPAG